MRLALGVLLAALPCFGQLTFSTVKPELVRRRIAEVQSNNHKRELQIASMFTEAGCGGQLEKQDIGSHYDNVICTFGANSASRILVTAHYDHVDLGDGVIDNWSGASLLPSLYQSLAAAPRKHQFLFIAFGREEQGLLGSQEYVHELPKEERAGIRAVVNIDSIGAGPTKVWVSQSDKQLVGLLAYAANALHVPVDRADVDRVGESDGASFHRKKVPTIDIHSLTNETFRILHSPRDTMTALRFDDYYQTYRLVAAYLVLLDRRLE